MSILFLVVVLLALFSSIFAFVPNVEGLKRRISTARQVINIKLPDDLPGAFPILGTDEKPYWDPLSLSDARWVTQKDLKRWRESELKHGRIAMLSVLGFLSQEAWNPMFSSWVGGPAIFHFEQVNQNLFSLLFPISIFLMAIGEFYSIHLGWDGPDVTLKRPNGVALLKDDYIPGDLKWDPLGLNPDKGTGRVSTFNQMSPELKARRSWELATGRIAMVAIAGFVAQELVDQRTIWEHWSMYGLGPGSPR